MSTSTLSPRIRTRLTDLLQCRHPILLPGMSWISTPPLVAAVSNAGGCGILATGPLLPEQTRQAIRDIRQKTHLYSNENDVTQNKPFGVGITWLMPGAKENMKIALEEQVPVINISLGKPPSDIVDEIHSYGGKLISTVTNHVHAQRAIESGADALLLTGHEAAAHGGDVTSLVLIPAIQQRFPNIPLIAAGGFASGAGLLAALSLGADGVAMGSRLAVTQESPLASDVKEVLSHPDRTEIDTLYGSNFDGIPARVLKTPVAQAHMKQRPFWGTIVYRAFQAAQAMKFPLWKVLPGLLKEYEKMYIVAQFGAATKAIQAATVEGDLDQKGVQFVGQSLGLIQDQPTVEELIERIIQEAHDKHVHNQCKFDDNDVANNDLKEEDANTSEIHFQ